VKPLDEFFARWNAVPMPIPLVEVVNTNVDLDGLPDQWAGAIYQSENAGDVTMGSQPWVEETGTIQVGLLARSGKGKDLLDAAVAALRTYFHGWVSADASVHFVSVIGPDDIDPEADGEWWRLGLRVPFIVQSRRSHPVPDA
jgi:hypothetical protein